MDGDLLSFIITVVLVTVSGALAPGPLFFRVISHGRKSGARGGLAFSIGHTLFEFSLVLFLAFIWSFGTTQVADESIMNLYGGIVGGLALYAFGAIHIYESTKSKTDNNQKEAKSQRIKHPLVLGLAYTGLNPFFIVWWLLVGANLVLLSLEFASLTGVVFMYICHVWIDYVWYMSVAHLAKMGTNIMGFRWYRVIMAVFGAVLIYFGLTFLIDSLISKPIQ